MKQASLSFQHVTFCYDTMTQPLIRDATFDFFKGWTGIVGINGAGKTTFLKLALGHLLPQRGSVTRRGTGLYCTQSTEERPVSLVEFLQAHDGEACRLKGMLALEEDWYEQWHNLSHGERKRAQLGSALWQLPDILAIDEPTNHLDLNTSALLVTALKNYAGVGLIVSHDRTLLDALCCQCLFVDPPELILRPGGYTQGKELERQDTAAVRRLYTLTKQEQRRLEKERLHRSDVAQSKQRQLSKKGLAPGDHDARAKRDLARLSGKDGVGGKLQRQLDSRVNRLEEQLASLHYKSEQLAGITINGQHLARNLLFDLPPVVLPLGERRSLHIPALQMRPQERIGVSGNNGAGKSTLIRYLVAEMPLAPGQLLYLPQELGLSLAEQLADRIKALNNKERGELMSAISRLGSRPERLLESFIPSPGEARKLLLAFGLLQTPALIIMDEPTNHLDIVSIECIEAALQKSGCGLLLVSHDRRFLEHLVSTRWEIAAEPGHPERFVLTVKAG